MCPVKEGFIPDSGAICALVTAATGKIPRYFGKPYLETAEFLVNAAEWISSRRRLWATGFTDIALEKQ